MFGADARPPPSPPFDEPFVIALAFLLLQQPPASAPASAYWQQDVAYRDHRPARRADRRAERGRADRATATRRPTRSRPSRFISISTPSDRARAGPTPTPPRVAGGSTTCKDPDFAFNHVRDVRIMGEPVEPSLSVRAGQHHRPLRSAAAAPAGRLDERRDGLGRAALDGPAPPGTGRAAASTSRSGIPRSSCTTGCGWEEHPLMPAGEFYGEFGPVHGRSRSCPRTRSWAPPASRSAATRAGSAPIARPAGRSSTSATTTARARRRPTRAPAPAPGRKRIRWYAERVHHFAMSLNPEYRYEGGHFGDVAVHVLYQPGDDTTWGGGVAVKRTQTALAWLDQLYGPFGWPQITNVHRIEGGGTEFPMMIHDGSADQGLIVHELGHNYTMGLLANNEWREGWLDEGFTSFQTSWFWETMGKPQTYARDRGRGARSSTSTTTRSRRASRRRRTATSPPTTSRSTPGASCSSTSSARSWATTTMHRILRTFYERWKYHHVDEAAFRAVAEEVSKRDLSTFFAQWLHTTELYDYAVGRVADGAPGRRLGDPGRGGAEVAGPISAGRGRDRRGRHGGGAHRRARRARVGRARDPDEAEAGAARPAGPLARLEHAQQPDGCSASRCRNRWPRRPAPTSTSTATSAPAYPPRPPDARAAAGGVVQRRRRCHPRPPEPRATTWAASSRTSRCSPASTGWGVDDGVQDVDFWFRLRNPVYLRAPERLADARRLQRRGPVRRHRDRRAEPARASHLRAHLDRVGSRCSGSSPTTSAISIRGYYDDVGTVELRLAGGVDDAARASGRWSSGARSAAGWPTTGTASPRAAGPISIRSTRASPSRAPPTVRSASVWGLARGSTRGWRAATTSRPSSGRSTCRAPIRSSGWPTRSCARGARCSRATTCTTSSPGGGGVRGIDPRVSTTAPGRRSTSSSSGAW